MNRDSFLPVLLALAAGLVCGAARADDGRKPNVVLIVADDLGFGDVGFHGNREIPTPHLDALAAAGTRFTNGYASSPLCGPTRAGLLTGRYQQRFGYELNPGGGGVRHGVGLPLTETTIAEAVRAAGYRTGLIGKWHLGSDPQFQPTARGFDEFYGFLGGAHAYQLPGARPDAQPILRDRRAVDEQEYLTDAIGREAVAFIDRHAGSAFLLVVAFNAVHIPLEAPARYRDRFPRITDPRHRTYAAMASAMDDNVGRILEALHRRQLDETTLVVFLSDNGGPPHENTSSNAPFSGAKGTLWEGGIRVPFVLRWTSRVPAGAVYHKPVISLDIAATVASAAGTRLSGPEPIDGVDLLPFVTGANRSSPHEQLTWRQGPQRAIRRGKYKLVQLAGQPLKLFDLAADHAEQHDLSSSEPEVVARLEQAYATWNNELIEPKWETIPLIPPGQSAAPVSEQVETQ